MEIQSAEVNGTKPKSLRTGRQMPYRQQKNRARKQSLLDSESLSLGVLSDDFAAVDVREELCYHSRPKKQIQEVNGTAKPIMRKLCTAEKAAADPERFSGEGSAPPRFRFDFPCCSCCLFRGVCLAAARVSAAHLSLPSTRHGAKNTFKYNPYRKMTKSFCASWLKLEIYLKKNTESCIIKIKG